MKAGVSVEEGQHDLHRAEHRQHHLQHSHDRSRSSPASCGVCDICPASRTPNSSKPVSNETRGWKLGVGSTYGTLRWEHRNSDKLALGNNGRAGGWGDARPLGILVVCMKYFVHTRNHIAGEYIEVPVRTTAVAPPPNSGQGTEPPLISLTRSDTLLPG